MFAQTPRGRDSFSFSLNGVRFASPYTPYIILAGDRLNRAIERRRRETRAAHTSLALNAQLR